MKHLTVRFRFPANMGVQFQIDEMFDRFGE